MLARIHRLIIFLFVFCSSYVLGEEKSPLDLVVPQRADIAAKYIYAKHRSWGVDCSFGKQLYYRHLQAWNGFSELDPPKRCFEDYFDAFNSLLDSIEARGFDHSYPVPLGKGGVICNGAHRLTSCLLYQKKVFVQPCPYECDFGFEFFQALGLETKYLDAMALQYCELKPNSYVIVIFPSAIGHEKEIEQALKRYTSIVYQKKISFTANGAVNLILTMYDQESWMGNIENDYIGARYKAQCCFPEGSADQQVRAYLVECPRLDHIRACKAKIRSLLNNHHSVHSTDTQKEAIVLARAFFNQNSIHCLNYRKDRHFPLFERYLTEYKKGLSEKENDWFCVDGGAVLAAYGLRECQDLDVLHYENDLPHFDSLAVESHNPYLLFHSLPLHDILFDPDNYFFYRGIKFCSLPLVKEMKQRRAEPKDFKDISLIDQVTPFGKPRTGFEGIPAA